MSITSEMWFPPSLFHQPCLGSLLDPNGALLSTRSTAPYCHLRFWPKLESCDLVMTGQFQSIQESYAKEFPPFKPDKQLWRLPHLGMVRTEFVLQDRKLELGLPPVGAAFLTLFPQNGARFTVDQRPDFRVSDSLCRCVGGG